MSAEPEYTTHTRVTVSIPHEDAMKLVRAGVGQTDERQWAGNHSAADLLDALDAVPTADMARVIGEAQCEADEWQARAEKAEATVARVRELAEKWRYKGEFGWGPWQEGEGPDPEGHILDCASSDLRDALDPKPAFTLPTEAGVRFEAVDNCGKRSVFEAVHDGPDIHYLNRRTYVIWSGENVMYYCTDHRLIGADQ